MMLVYEAGFVLSFEVYVQMIQVYSFLMKIVGYMCIIGEDDYVMLDRKVICDVKVVFKCGEEVMFYFYIINSIFFGWKLVCE